LAGLRPGDRLLEVGCATGKATIPLAQHGFQITCVEIGAELAVEATRNLAQFPGVQVIQEAFETWRPPRMAVFDLVLAATAWHWIDPAVKYRRAWELLRPGGHLAFWSAAHVFPPGGDPFFRDIQDVYEEIGEGLPPDAAWPSGPPGACGGSGERYCMWPSVSPTLILPDDRSPSSVPVPCQNGQPPGVFHGHSRTAVIVASLARSRLMYCRRRPPKH
jgi:SAM-dependent methyltransferase